MIYVSTQEDVIGAMRDGAALWGKSEPGRRGYTYFLQAASPYAAKLVSPKLVAALEKSGQITGVLNVYGDLRYRLGSAEPLQEKLLGA